jgi:transposase
LRCIALDVHQKYCKGTELLPNGKVRRFRIPTTREGIEQFAQKLDFNVRLAMEATGNAHWIYDLILPYVGEVLLANPIQTRAIAEARIKTDELDAETLVRLLHADFIPQVWVPTPEQRQLWVLLQYRLKLVQLRTRLKNTVHAVLARNGYQNPVAIVATARKLLVLIWMLLVRGEHYRAAEPQRTKVKQLRLERRAMPYQVVKNYEIVSRVRRLLTEEDSLPQDALNGACAFS